ncbi:UxaA family hydrolase [Thalassospira lucentensis]|uniref:UxaA family hydrolase n=1 Tax=Thalassospira lucentensis TaxID=168935 RepID=UPI003D2A7673
MTTSSPDSILLHPGDNVEIALGNLAKGARLSQSEVLLSAPVTRGHKIAIRPIAAGDPVLRYGQIIGAATTDIAPGDHVHTHNIGMSEHRQDYDFAKEIAALPAATEQKFFMGYPRSDGRFGTRNYIGVLTSVNCSGSVARFMAEQAEKTGWFAELENVDGIVPIVHGSGCGMGRHDEGYDTLFRTLSGYAKHPNFGGILLVGLGCEAMQVEDLVGAEKLRHDGNFHYMTIQNSGGTRQTVERGVDILHDLALRASKVKRVRVPASELVVGLQCGGSDGYSGITANPALGYASDLLVRQGGTTILSETPEIYGAEHLLTRRAISVEVGQKLVDRINWWENYTSVRDGEMNNNPSPGNKRGGLTTILEKSLGAVAKGGTAPLTDVYQFGQIIDKKGFVFMDSPGYDPCSVTGQIASGATLIAFTTGRGSVSGYIPSPCIKLSTNTAMYENMHEDMDINCGDIADGNVTIEDKGHEIFEMFLRVASGTESKSEALGFGNAEFVPWQIGAVM